MYGKPKPASHNSTSYINKPIRIFAAKKEHPSHLYQVSQASSIIPHLWPICLKRKPNNLHKIHCIPFSKSPNTIYLLRLPNILLVLFMPPYLLSMCVTAKNDQFQRTWKSNRIPVFKTLRNSSNILASASNVKISKPGISRALTASSVTAIPILVRTPNSHHILHE